jgi:hypothetical protein
MAVITEPSVEYSKFSSPVYREAIQPKNSTTFDGEKYSDFFNDIIINPVTGDLAKRTNEEAVRQSIINLILTGRGERPFQPLVGSDIYQLLFETITLETTSLLETNCSESHESD